MLMMLFGSGAISSVDKRKVMEFIRELTELANLSRNPELKEGLDYILKNGLERLRQDTDVSADDLAELERIILQAV
jgi:predicted component of type VI protein secretion system